VRSKRAPVVIVIVVVVAGLVLVATGKVRCEGTGAGRVVRAKEAPGGTWKVRAPRCGCVRVRVCEAEVVLLKWMGKGCGLWGSADVVYVIGRQDL
jgi:hypothetical protein